MFFDYFIHIFFIFRQSLALESPFYTKSNKSTYWDQCFEHLECLGRGSFAEVRDMTLKSANIYFTIIRFTKFGIKKIINYMLLNVH